MNMRKLTLICAVLVLPVTITYSEGENLQESREPTWIERIFGVNDAEESSTDGVKAEEVEDVSALEEDSNQDGLEQSQSDKAVKGRTFTREEREILESWQKGNAGWKKSKKPLPPGLKKKLERGGELPAGWRKKLEVGRVLDPEIDAKAESLPEEILKRLPEPELGTEVLRVGDQIIRVIERSREIVDILNDMPLEGAAGN